MVLPLLAYGRSTDMGRALGEAIKPDIELVHLCITLEAALAEIPRLAAGDKSTPNASGVGSNLDRSESERLIPKVISFGGGVPSEEVEQVTAAVKAAGVDPYFAKISIDEVKALGGISAENIAVALRNQLQKAGLL